jgi:hypothetical protein
MFKINQFLIGLLIIVGPLCAETAGAGRKGFGESDFLFRSLFNASILFFKACYCFAERDLSLTLRRSLPRSKALTGSFESVIFFKIFLEV